MTPTARTVLPTDLVALVSYDGRVYANEAMTLDRIGTGGSPHPLETAFEQWLSFATGKHTWISVKGATLRGLISARKRGSKLAWEIDCLIDADNNDGGVLVSLLDKVAGAAGKSGAHRIFLRVPAGSQTEREAARRGFAPYRSEVMHCRVQEPSAPYAPAAGVRRRVKADLYPTFQVYNAVVPENVRRFEAATLAEWTAVQENIGRAQQFVYEDDAGIGGWLRLAADGDVGRFEVYGEERALDSLVDTALARLANRRSICAVVPAEQGGVRRRLESAGFEATDEYTVLVRLTVRPVKESKKAPALAQTTFG